MSALSTDTHQRNDACEGRGGITTRKGEDGEGEEGETMDDSHRSTLAAAGVDEGHAAMVARFLAAASALHETAVLAKPPDPRRCALFTPWRLEGAAAPTRRWGWWRVRRWVWWIWWWVE